ncbi:nucleotidyl transferase AbiEii/AbiGii toxin family protein [Acidobacteriota bacterium]
MMKDMLAERIRDYRPANSLEQENVLQELMQSYVLASLSRARFFAGACFHGGTCLRVLYGMNRFSEDLDFLLKVPDPRFLWEEYLEKIGKDFQDEGIQIEFQDRSEVTAAVKKAFIKTDSIGKILDLDLPYTRHKSKKVRIKLEIDTNPPEGSVFETRYLSFPVISAITTQTLESSFATKSHALLCRTYAKGRDWYDFLWYVARRTVPDLTLLGNAIFQQGPWEGKKRTVSCDWYIETLRKAIRKMDWAEVRKDVGRFVIDREQESLELWGTDLFLQQVDQLQNYLVKRSSKKG